ncbi:MAG: immunoglobulin domain-containing protein, partial [Chitinophagales bacterium]
SLSGYINNVTFTNCYSNAAFPNPPNGSTVRFPFSNAFIWDGTSNVLVEICQDNTAFSGFIGFEATAQTNPMVFGTRQDNNTGLCVNNSASFNQTMRVNPTFFQFVKYPITWSPTTGLFTNAVASSAYTSGARDTVWSAHNDTIKYFMTATHPNSCAINDSIVLNVKDTVTINTQPPAFIAFCAGDTLKLSVAASSSSPMTYQWKKNGLNISTALNASAGTNMLIIPNCVQADSGGYEVEISTGAPCGPKSSITSTVKVRLPITITTQPNDNTVCVGSSFCLSAAAMNDSSRVWTQLTGANTGTNNTLCISSSAYADSGRYFITYIPQTPCPTKNSDTVRVRVLPPALIAADPASLTTLCIGDSVTLKATHTGALSFQWLKNGLPIGGAITDSLKVKATALTDSGEYRLVVYSPPGCTNDTTSVNTGVIKINLPVSIATQPLAKTFVCQNSPFNASVTASNTSGYQWEKDAVTIFAATNAAFNAITSTQPSDAGVYRVLVKGLAPCPDVNSTNDTLVVTTLAAITTPPTAFQVCEDQSISITGAASNAASYQWLRNGVAISPNGNVQTYTKGGSPATMADSGMYRLVALSNPAGATTCKADTSAAVLGAVVRKIQITTQPLANTFVCQNSAFNTSILAQNVTGYQWRKGAINGSTGTGGTTANYSITSTQPADAGVYSVLMTGNSPCPTVTSTNNTLAVTTLAAITTPPTAFHVCEDQSISITGAASNAASYQWLRNGVAISPNGNV